MSVLGEGQCRRRRLPTFVQLRRRRIWRHQWRLLLQFFRPVRSIVLSLILRKYAVAPYEPDAVSSSFIINCHDSQSWKNYQDAQAAAAAAQQRAQDEIDRMQREHQRSMDRANQQLNSIMRQMEDVRLNAQHGAARRTSSPQRTQSTASSSPAAPAATPTTRPSAVAAHSVSPNTSPALGSPSPRFHDATEFQ